MRKFAFIIATIFTALLFTTSCGGGSDSGVIGKWKIVKAEGTMAELNKDMIYNFVDDKKLIMEKGFKNEGTYTISGDTLAGTFGSVTIKSIIKIDGKKMTMTIINSDQKFELEKQ